MICTDIEVPIQRHLSLGLVISMFSRSAEIGVCGNGPPTAELRQVTMMGRRSEGIPAESDLGLIFIQRIELEVMVERAWSEQEAPI